MGSYDFLHIRQLAYNRRDEGELADAAHERLVRENGWEFVIDEFLRLCTGKKNSIRQSWIREHQIESDTTTK